MDDLLAEFVAEAREMLEAVGGELVAWEADPSDSSRLDAIFRFVHTVKGNCGFFDLPRLERLSHAAESTLAEVRAGRRQPDSALVTAILAVVDRISDMVDLIDNGEEIPDDGDDVLIAALEEGADDLEMRAQVPNDEPAPKVPSATPSNVRSIRLPVTLLDRVMSGVSDLVLARNDLARRLREAGSQPEIDGPFERLTAILDDVRDGITRIRMQRIEYLFGTLPRLIRDLSAELGKQVLVDIEGGNVELDREMIEIIRDPVMHIIRNCLDHGIEAPSDRLSAGKREIGLLQVSARQTGNKIVLHISDDGRGIDDSKLARNAVAAGLIDEDRAKAMSQQQRLELMFEPGLSTADTVTSISGRGVGMDVVRANIERVGGEVYVSSEMGKGTTIFLRLPLTLSIIPALTVAVGDQTFALPRAHIEEIVDAANDDLEFTMAGDILNVSIRGRWVPCAPIGQVLGVADPTPPEQGLLVVAQLGNGATLAMVVDRILDHEDLVIKPLAPVVMNTGLFSGSTLLDDGTPVLMLDIVGIVQRAGLPTDGKTGADLVVEETGRTDASKAVPVLKFAGMDGRWRAIPMEVVSRIEKVPTTAIDLSAQLPQVVVDGMILPLAGTEGGAFEDREVAILRLGDGVTEIAYAFAGAIDTALIDSAVVTARMADGFESVTLVGGDIAELVDCHRLFAELAPLAGLEELPVCRLPSGDQWVDSILKPLVEAAGYRVEFEVGSARPDVEISLNGLGQVGSGEDHPVIELRTRKAIGGAAEESIYRYDREGLIAALESARNRGGA